MPSDISQVSLNFDAVRYWSHLVGIVLAIVVAYVTRRRGTRWSISIRGAVGAIGILAFAYHWTDGFGRVQPGARGVVLRFGAPTGRIAGEGLYAVIPFAERVVSVNTQINTIHFDRTQGPVTIWNPSMRTST